MPGLNRRDFQTSSGRSGAFGFNLAALWIFLVGVGVGAFGMYLFGAKSGDPEIATNDISDKRSSQSRSKPGLKGVQESESRSGQRGQKANAGVRREMNVSSGEFSPMPSPLASAFVLSPAVRNEHNLTDEATIKIQNLLRKVHGNLTEYTVREVRRDETLDVPGENFAAYRVPADPELGQRLEAELALGIEEEGGAEVADVLTELVREQMDFLKFARCDLVLKLHETEGADGYQVSYQFRNAVSGEFGGGGRMGLVGFNKQFGQIFSVVEE